MNESKKKKMNVKATERELDLENLRKLRVGLEIDDGLDLEKIADELPKLRKSKDWLQKQRLASYGRDQDLDRLVVDENLWVRKVVASRGLLWQR